MVDAVAQAAGVPAAEVRRAAMLARRPRRRRAVGAREGGGRPCRLPAQAGSSRSQPMLAQTAADVTSALERVGSAARRVEARRRADPGPPRGRRDPRLHPQPAPTSRTAFPRSSRRVRALPTRRDRARRRGDRAAPGRAPAPVPGHDAPVRAKLDVEELRTDSPLSPFFFDCLHLDGEDLLDRPGASVLAALDASASAAAASCRAS